MTNPLRTYQGQWQVRKTSKAIGGQERWTTQRGARWTNSRTWAKGQTLRIYAHRGPGQSRVRILVDGKQVTIIDLGAATYHSSRTVYKLTLNNGPHMITMENLATRGRRQMSFDAFSIQNS